MKRTWYKGDTHLHTLNSDGKLTPEQLITKCKDAGLDFMIITDHNYNSLDKSYYDDNMLIIQGQELTDELGHVNVWGEKVPSEPPHKITTYEDYLSLVNQCKQAGATVSMNHPFCSNCPFLMDMEAFDFDCVEVWNTLQHCDNMKNRDWWVNQLLKGNHIAAVGGSDYHTDYVVTNLLANPTTIVHAKSNSKEDILQAMREGRSVITNTPNSSMIYLTCGDAHIGDTVSLRDNNTAHLKVTKLKKNHTIIVYNNDKIIFSHKAKGNGDFSTDIIIKEAGFIRAEITYKLSPLREKIQVFGESKFMSKRGKAVDFGQGLPDFIWAFTNPIWIIE